MRPPISASLTAAVILTVLTACASVASPPSASRSPSASSPHAGRRPHTVHKVVTSQVFIARLAGTLDRLPAEPTETVACPAIFADYQLAFSVSRHSRPVVVVWSNETGCGGSAITVNGRPQPSLADDGAVAALVDHVVSVTWEL